MAQRAHIMAGRLYLRRFSRKDLVTLLQAVRLARFGGEKVDQPGAQVDDDPVCVLDEAVTADMVAGKEVLVLRRDQKPGRILGGVLAG